MGVVRHLSNAEKNLTSAEAFRFASLIVWSAQPKPFLLHCLPQEVFKRADVEAVREELGDAADRSDLPRLKRFVGQPVPPEPSSHRACSTQPWAVSCLTSKL